MIKIHEKLWGIFNNHKKQYSHLDTDAKLAYMTYKQDNPAFEKRKETGIKWATYSNKDVDVSTLTFEHDNVPVDGFKLIDTVERYATSNKLFRVLDPRGFIVEVSTEYIFELIQNSTIEKGLIKDKCIWGVDRTSHVLIPVTSNLYIETVKDQDTIENKLLTFANLVAGDVFKVFQDNDEYVYLGKAKCTYEFSICTRTYNRMSSEYTFSPARHIADIEDNNYVHVYYNLRPETCYRRYECNQPKIVSIVKSNYDITKLREEVQLYAPKRVYSKYYDTVPATDRHSGNNDEQRINIKSTIWKDK